MHRATAAFVVIRRFVRYLSEPKHCRHRRSFFVDDSSILRKKTTRRSQSSSTLCRLFFFDTRIAFALHRKHCKDRNVDRRVCSDILVIQLTEYYFRYGILPLGMAEQTLVASAYSRRNLFVFPLIAFNGRANIELVSAILSSSVSSSVSHSLETAFDSTWTLTSNVIRMMSQSLRSAKYLKKIVR